MNLLKFLYFSTAIILFFLSLNAFCEKLSIERIAHAGGSYQGDTYTNSFEALNFNINAGFKFFEIDFSWTKDEQLVCIHDWNQSFKKTFGFEIAEKPTLETFQFLVKNLSPYHECTLDELQVWMNANPQAYLVTDIKERNLEALALIAKKIDNFQERVIPQCYFPEHYAKIQNLGYKNIIWTLYRYTEDNANVLQVIDRLDKIFAVTMPPHRAKLGLGHALFEKGIPSYVHTMNTVDELILYQQKYGITEIYTDFLSPKNNQSLNQKKEVPKTSDFSEDNCRASYFNNGSVYIPCVSIADSDKIFEVYLQQQSPKIFELKQIQENPNF